MKLIRYYHKHDIPKIVLGALLFAAGMISERLDTLYLHIIFYVLSIALSGYEIFISSIMGILRRDFLDEKLLMSIGAIGALIIGEYSEGCAVIIFFLLGEYFEHLAVKRSRTSIKNLMDICPDEATVIRDGVTERIDAEDVEVGDILILRAGERVAVDCIVISGNAGLDTSAITGEALPREAGEGTVIESGTVVLDGMLNAKALRVASESAASRILSLVETASENKSREEYFITKFAKYYTPTVIALAVLVATLPVIFGWLTIREGVYRALVFLVFSCPCALVISVPMAFFGGIGCAASRGILYKGGNVMSPLSRAKIFAFDKTGTLTSGKFKISEITPIGVSTEKLLYLTASAEYGSNHPIAECIKNAAGEILVPTEVKEYAGMGLSARVGNDTVYVGNKSLMQKLSVSVPRQSGAKSYVYTAQGGKLLGIIGITDTVKGEAKNAINELKELGVQRTVMLTGDISESAEGVAKELGIDEYHAELLPEEKYSHLEKLIAEDLTTVYVGDGINDVPSIALADVGVAMGALGSNSAIESADLVIMSDTLDRLPEAIRIARKTLTIAKENIVFALGVKSLVLLLGALGYLNMWLAVFADVGVAMLAILNAMRALIYKPKSKQ